MEKEDSAFMWSAIDCEGKMGAHTLGRQQRCMSASAQGDGNDWECVKIFSRNHVLKDQDHLPLKQGEVGG